MKINKFYIDNFRSLVDFNVDGFDTTTIFYGENNAGKSNVLEALEIIFKRKRLFQDGDFTSHINFYQGIIEGFSNNFYNNIQDSIIKFFVEISIDRQDLIIDNSIEKLLKKWPNEIVISVEGIIKRYNQSYDLAEIVTNKISINGIYIYEVDEKKTKYFPTLLKSDGSNISELSSAFTNIIDPLNNCVYIIESNRIINPSSFNEKIISFLTPTDFKKSLYSLYLDERRHSIFEQINEVFNQEPFSFGEISFANINDSLELMIKNNGVRLPINHLGSGVEQILFIITCLLYSRNKIICIEELEQNLSPKLQNLALRKLQSMIGKHFDQLIISSHSSVFAKRKLSNSIYLIKKEELKTIVSEKMNGSYGNELKKHFIDTALPYDTYTEEELKLQFEEIKKLAEKIFRR